MMNVLILLTIAFLILFFIFWTTGQKRDVYDKGADEIREKSRGYKIEVDGVEFYSDEDWRREYEQLKVIKIGMKQCPRCGIEGLGTHLVFPNRKYRACKACGFWQEVGGPPYLCSIFGHICDGDMKAQFMLPWDNPKPCKVCGRENKKISTMYDQLTNKQ